MFIYTRFRSQNSRNIWGMYFPQFSEKESRLFEQDELDDLFRRVPGLIVQAVELFKYQRVCSLDQLVEKARHRDYSTFCFYSRREFTEALKEFYRKIRDHYEDLDRVTWFGENVLMVVRKIPD